jgi:hypothetical protein
MDFLAYLRRVLIAPSALTVALFLFMGVASAAGTSPPVKDAKGLGALLRAKGVACGRLMDMSSAPPPIHHLAARVARNGYGVCDISGSQNGAADLYVFGGSKQRAKQLGTVKAVACAIGTGLSGSGFGSVPFFLITGPNWAIAFQGSVADGTAVATALLQPGEPIVCADG